MKTKLILVGSSVSMMKDKVLSYKSPLYGRRTGQIKLESLKFKHISEFYPKASPKELVKIYGLIDGIPYYREKVQTPFWSWLNRELKDPKSFLKEEEDFLLRYEFEEVGTYKRILEAIANGKNKLGEIKSFVAKELITEYIKNLAEIGLIEYIKPIAGGKRGIYRIKDNFTRFWFRYIYPNLIEIELKLYTANKIKQTYNIYLGEICEKIAKQLIVSKIRDGELPEIDKIGKWWHKGEEIDIVGLKGAEIGIFTEVKWSHLTSKDIRKTYDNLTAKSTRFNVKEKIYVIVCRTCEKTEIENLKTYTVEDTLQ